MISTFLRGETHVVPAKSLEETLRSANADLAAAEDQILTGQRRWHVTPI